MNFLDIQSWWEIPCIAHFCSLFRSPFHLPEFDIEDLEEALLADGTSGDTPNLLSELVVSLLKGCDIVQKETITTSNYQMFLKRLLRQKCKEYNFENTFDKDIDFQSLPLHTKILNLHLLCDIRLDSIDVGPIYNCLEPESLRVDPLGYDSKGSTYWYFHGTRLYREDKLKPANGNRDGKSTIWQVICFTEDDWNNLANKLKNGSEKERALRQTLEADFLPKLPQLFKQKERLRRKKLIQVRSHRIRAQAEIKAEREKIVAEQARAISLAKQEKKSADNRENRARRRSQSSSIQSIISTYASSSPTAHSSDLLFQSNKFNYIVHSRSSDSDSDNISIISTHNNLNQINEQHSNTPYWSPNDDAHDVKRLLQKYILNKEDKENINTITLSTDSSDTEGETTMPPTNNTNAKLPGRQTNNSLSSLTGNIFIPPFESGSRTDTRTDTRTDPRTDSTSGADVVVGSSRNIENSQSNREEPPPAQPPRKKKLKSTDVFTSTLIPTLSFTETEEVLQIGMHKVLEYVKNHKDAWPFMDPVEEDIAPSYYTIIRRPMDLLKMEEKLDNGEYQTFNDFRNDFKLIVNNCRLYNGQNNEYTEMVNNLQLAFEKSTKKYFEQNSSDEEINLEYPDLKTNVFREKNFNAKNMTPKQLLLNEINKKAKEEPDVTSGKKVSVDKEKLSAKSSKGSRDESRDRDAVNTSRGIKRKRKDKDKRRKKKTKVGKNAKHFEKSDDDDDIESAKSDNSDDDDDEPPVKVMKKNVKPTTIVTPEKKSKGVSNKNKKVVVKAKQKSSKRVCSDDDQDEENLEDDEEMEEKMVEEKKVIKNVPVKSKKNSKNGTKLSKNGTKPSKNDPSPSKSDIKPKVEEPKAKKSKITVASKKDGKHKKVDSSHDEKEAAKLDSSTKVKKTKGDKSILQKKSEKIDKKPEKIDKKPEKVDKKPAKVDKKPAVPLSDNDSENDLNSEMGSDKGVIDYPMKKKSKSNSTKVPHKVEAAPAKPSKKDKQNSKDKKKMEKENQNFKSKRKLDKNAKKDSKKGTKVKSSNKTKSEDKVVVDDRRYRSSSRSVTPIFTVDLHKKYSKSASIPDTPGKTNAKPDDKDLMSISSRSFSRSLSPLASHYSSNHSLNSLEDESRSPSKSKKGSRSDRPITPDIKDKFDLIKERRSRNNDEKWNQIVKEAEKIKDKTASNQATNVTNATLEKNQKLKETIEKLKAKAKNKSSKERAGLLNEIFGAKPTKEVRDERSIFERLRDTSADGGIKPKAEKSSKNKADEYNFVEDVVAETKPSTAVATKETSASKAKPQKKSVNKVNAAKNLKSTNMEALEMETEQTLKDINRWLEHTPRFPDFGSASNSPSRYNLLDDFDTVTAKLEADFRRPDLSKTAATSSVPTAANDPQCSSANTVPTAPATVPPNTNNDFNLLKETPNVFITPTPPVPPALTSVPTNAPRQTIQLQGIPSAPGTHKRDPKEPKRKSLKEKLSSMPKRKDLHRTIERLQPGKAKGNLINSSAKSDDPSVNAGTSVPKPKEIKNSLLQPTVESGPKLSLGSVLDETGFGLGQQHNFGDDSVADSVNVVDETSKDRDSDDMEIEEIITSTEMQKELAKSEKQKLEALEKESPNQSSKSSSSEKLSATPNLSAWFKAFGAPKKTKKSEEEESLSAVSSLNSNEFEKSLDLNNSDSKSLIEPSILQPSSPTEHPPGFMLPTPRTRKASTNSTVSERSSFSQDPDSPRVAIDERIGSVYGATYPSQSPLMASPKDELQKPSSPYQMNGAIKVGFYQDTTTKSSPEKSCSPREPPSPYNYAQNLYSSASATVAAAYGGSCSYSNPTEPPQTATLGFNNKNKTPSYYDQYKQPRSQDSDYNSSMSPNPNSPYQNQQQSPYQAEASPYQQPQSSPYQQPHSPFHQQQQSATASAQQQAVTSEPSPHTQFPAPNSPYQQQTSPYQQPNSPIGLSHMAHLPPQQQQQQQQAVQANSFGPPAAAFPQTQQQTIPKAVPGAQHQHSIGSHQSPNFHSNPSSPYSQHDPNSPYSQQGPISPYNTLPNSPKSQQQQQPKPNHSQQEWGNSIGNLSQQHQPPNPMEPPKISNSMTDQLGNSYPIPAHMTSTNKHPPNTHGYHMPTYANPYAPTSLIDQLRTDDPTIPKQSIFNTSISHPHSPNNEPSGASVLNMGMDSLPDNRHMNLLKPNESSVSPSNRHNQMHQSPRDLVNLGFPEQNLPQSKNTHAKPIDKPLNTTVSDARSLETPKPSLNTEPKGAADAAKHQQQVFDHLLGTMGFSKNLGFGKGMDISTSKALEMFNRAATMGFPKGFPTSAGAKNDEITKISASMDGNFPRPSSLHSASPLQAGSQSQKALFDMINMGYQQPQVGHDKAMSHDHMAKPLNMVNNTYNPQQMLSKGDYTNNVQPDLQQQSKQQHTPSMSYPTNLSSQSQKSANNDLNIPSIRALESTTPNQQQKPCELNVPNLQRYDLNRPPHSNIDLSNYKSSPYSSPGLDPNSLRKMDHLSMMDENLLGLQSSAGYYQKDIPPAHMYSKNIPQTSANLQQMLNNSMTMVYNTTRDQQIQQNYQRLPHSNLTTNSPNLSSAPPTNQAAQHYMNPIPNQPMSGIDPKVSKRTKKKKTSTPTPAEVIQNQLLQQQQQQQQQQQHREISQQQQHHQQQQQQHQLQQQQQHQNQQGFQSYAGLKSNPSSVKGSPSTDPSLALKTAAANMVPGSAFNFGPTPTGLGLYGDPQTGYLDEFRGTPNPYYLPGPPHPTGHRGTTEVPNDKLVQPPTPSSTYHQFLSHPSSRTTYPFMNAQLDPNSQIYQQYFQRQEDLRTARLMLNQGLLSHGAPGGYPQSSYLGMHKSSFDAMNQMNRPSSWFP